MLPGLTVVMPAFNEEESLEESVRFLVESISSVGISVEVIIVNDGSEDRTGEVGESLSQSLTEVRAVHHAVNQGWGEAVRTGIANAKQELVVLSPVDNPLSGAEVLKFLESVENADIVIGYRVGRPGYSLWLRIASKCYHLLVKMLFGLRLRDVNWIHIYRKAAIESLPLTLSGIVFPAEVLVKAHRKEYRIVEIHSTMKPRTSGRPTVSRPRVILRAMGDLFRLWREMRKPEWAIGTRVERNA